MYGKREEKGAERMAEKGKVERRKGKGDKSRIERKGEERENKMEGKRDGLCGESVDPAAVFESCCMR